ncbi:MAG: hypothetical protein E7070_00010 [Bacteroidales bacterium]|jgi:hypothetical protein|nr:hypothetical protein [Bacteroidales bacterium]
MSNIISLTVENFRSYKDETTFSFEAIESDECNGNYHDVVLANGENIRLLNSAVFYGANAAGKSTIIFALYRIQEFVLDVEKNIKNIQNKELPYFPHLLSESTKNAPIKMGLDFIVNKEIYSYAFSYNKNGFITEKLKNKSRDITLFSRDGEGNVKYDNNLLPEFNSVKIFTKIIKYQLVLSRLVTEENVIIQSIISEIASMIILPFVENRSLWGDVQKTAEHIWKAPESQFSRLIEELIVSSDTQIKDIKIVKNKLHLPSSWPTEVKSKFRDSYGYEVKMLHKMSDSDNLVEFNLSVESAGTKTLFSAAAQVLLALEKGSLLAYDEMNIALHPKLFRRLVELFHNEVTNPNHAQLLITTHDATLLEDNLMRADQIWFAEKENGASKIYSAIDFNGVSIDQPFEGWYRAGRLGARPNILPFKLNIERNNKED